MDTRKNMIIPAGTRNPDMLQGSSLSRSGALDLVPALDHLEHLEPCRAWSLHSACRDHKLPGAFYIYARKYISRMRIYLYRVRVYGYGYTGARRAREQPRDPRELQDLSKRACENLLVFRKRPKRACGNPVGLRKMA